MKKTYGRIKKSHDRNKFVTLADNRAQTEDGSWFR